MNLSPRRPIFNQRTTSNVYRVFFLTLLILGALWVVYGVKAGDIKTAGVPSPTPTRGALSFESEGDAYFRAGKLGFAISAYQKAIQVDPTDAGAWAEMARIQAYSSALTTTDDEKRTALLAALQSINQAKVLAPDSSDVAAIRAFVLDWNANDSIFPDTAADSLLEAEQEATRARQLDPQNVLALAYNAEILIDQKKLVQADQLLRQALALDQNQMDVHRINAYLLESEAGYKDAITEYDNAIQLMPNLTFLYLNAGANYRRLAFGSTIDTQQTDLYVKSLEYFEKATKINAQLEVKDPIPYLSIAKTYSQMGEYFIAGRNVQKALDFKPDDADIYGQLGIVFFKSRNYEGAIPALQCAVRGCTPDESCDARYGDKPCKPDLDEIGVDVKGLPLSNSTMVYYYTYGSVMASLSRPRQNYCPKALKVFQELRAFPFGTDTDGQAFKRDVLSIVAEGENICRSVGQPTSIPTPDGTLVPVVTETPAPGTE
jgi:tetratricopeptide (TPR) repeat protein